MAAVWARARGELRARWRAWAGLALVVGVAAGGVLAAAAGARRTDGAYGRFLAAQRGADVFYFRAPSVGFGDIEPDHVARLPQVAAVGTATYVATATGELNAHVAADGRYGRVVNRPKLLAGRMPALDRADEVAVSFTLARSRGLEVGGELPLVLLPTGPEGSPTPTPMSFRVVGVEASPGEFPPRTGSRRHAVHLSPALLGTHVGRQSVLGEVVAIRLKPAAADVAAFQQVVRELAGDSPILVEPTARQAANVQRSMRLQAIALWVVAALLALVSAFLLSQQLARQTFLGSADQPTLSALGMTRSQLWAAVVAPAAPTTLAGVSLAAAFAWAASPLMPLGNARVAEPNPGFSFDGAVVGLGVVGTVVVVLCLTALAAWRQTRARAVLEDWDAGVGRSPVARALGAMPFSPPAAAGIRMAAAPGRGARAVPVRTSIAGVTVGVAALAAALIFGAGLTHLLETPRLYGWTWHAYLQSNDFEGTDVVRTLVEDPEVEAVAFADSGSPVAVGDVETEGFAIGHAPKGSIEPVIVAGRAPRGGDELALGKKTMKAAGVGIGDRVDVRITAFDAAPVSKRVVAEVVLPSLGDASRFGVGAYLTYEGLTSMVPPDATFPAPGMLVRFAPGVEPQRAVADLERRVADTYAVLGAQRPGDVENFGQVEQLPLVLAALLAILAGATLLHTLLTAVRRRRRELAVLKTLGFTRGQVRATIAWQATMLVGAALLLGIPIGAAAGRWGWILFAEQLGAVPQPVVPGLPLLLVAPAAVVLANLMAAVPAALAARTRPSLALRAE